MSLNISVQVPLVVSDNTVLQRNLVKANDLPALEGDVNPPLYNLNELQQALEEMEANYWMGMPQQRPPRFEQSQDRTSAGTRRFPMSFGGRHSSRDNFRSIGASVRTRDDLGGNSPFGWTRNPEQSHGNLYPRERHLNDLRRPSLGVFTNRGLGLNNYQEQDGQCTRPSEELIRSGTASNHQNESGLSNFYQGPAEMSGAYSNATHRPLVNRPERINSGEVPPFASPSRSTVPYTPVYPTPAVRNQGDDIFPDRSLHGPSFNQHHRPATRSGEVGSTSRFGNQEAAQSAADAQPTDPRARASLHTRLTDSILGGDVNPRPRELLGPLHNLRNRSQPPQAKPRRSNRHKSGDQCVQFDHCCCYIGTFNVHGDADEDEDGANPLFGRSGHRNRAGHGDSPPYGRLVHQRGDGRGDSPTFRGPVPHNGERDGKIFLSGKSATEDGQNL